MALPADVKQLGTFQGAKGDKGLTGTIAYATAETIPADQPADAEMIGPESNRGAHFQIPRGLPGVNALANDEATATYISAEDSDTAAALRAAYSDQGRMGIVLPQGSALGVLTHAAVQAACDAALAESKRVWAAGTITTDQTLLIRSDADLGGLTINYTGSGVAVQVGEDSSVTFRRNVTLPRVLAANKVGAGWAGVAGTVGVRLVNLNTCPMIVVPHVRGFETGLAVVGIDGRGNAYNTILVGHLDNNKVNLLLTASTAGWSNQNTYLGGRYGHESAEGLNVAGVRQVQMTTGLPNPINNNKFVNASFEYGTAEFHLDIAGSSNGFDNCRYEVAGGARVRWQADATDNQILYGYQSRAIIHTYLPGAGRNHVYHSNGGTRASGGAVVLENTSGSTAPVEYVLAAGGISTGVDPATAFAVKRTANATEMKRNTDAFPRLRLDHQAGRVYVGPGTADPTIYIGAVGSSLGIGGAATQTTAPAAGGAAALPATPAGYVSIAIEGTVRRIPYY